MYKYCVIAETAYLDDIGTYSTFGLAVYRRVNTTWQQLCSVSDVSTSESIVAEMAARYTAAQLDPTHLRDLLEDEL